MNKWTAIESMKKRRAGAGVAELHGCLYVVGKCVSKSTMYLEQIASDPTATLDQILLHFTVLHMQTCIQDCN